VVKLPEYLKNGKIENAHSYTVELDNPKSPEKCIQGPRDGVIMCHIWYLTQNNNVDMIF